MEVLCYQRCTNFGVDAHSMKSKTGDIVAGVSFKSSGVPSLSKMEDLERDSSRPLVPTRDGRRPTPGDLKVRKDSHWTDGRKGYPQEREGRMKSGMLPPRDPVLLARLRIRVDLEAWDLVREDRWTHPS